MSIYRIRRLLNGALSILIAAMRPARRHRRSNGKLTHRTTLPGPQRLSWHEGDGALRRTEVVVCNAMRSPSPVTNVTQILVVEILP